MGPIKDSKLGFTGASVRCTHTEQMEAVSGTAPRPRRLHSREELMMLLSLNEEQVQFLVNTRLSCPHRLVQLSESARG